MNENKDILDYLIELSKESYEQEKESTEKIKDRIELISGLMITPSLALLIYLFSNYKGKLLSSFDLAFFSLPATISAILLLVAISILLHTFGGGAKYQRLPLPSEIKHYFEQMKLSSTNEDIEIDLRNGVYNAYCEAVDFNSAVNIRRTNRVLLAARISILSLIFIAISSPLYIYRAAASEKEVTPVKIISPLKFSLEESHEQQQPKTAKQSTKLNNESTSGHSAVKTNVPQK